MPYKDPERRRQYLRVWRARQKADPRKAEQERARARRKRAARPWEPRFVGVDGEAFQGKDGRQYYGLLVVDGHPLGPLARPRQLRTAEVLGYLTYPRKNLYRAALVGFSLGYDFEQWLWELSDDERERLEAGEKVVWREWVLRYVPRKFLAVKRQTDRAWVWVQDVFGFFQTSFVKALEEWGIPVPESIRAGKAARGSFRWQDLPQVLAYNAEELSALRALMQKLAAAFRDAYAEAGLPIALRQDLWHGPGAHVARWLETVDFAKDFPECPLPKHLAKGVHLHAGALVANAEAYVQHPGALAYFGGRIEAAAVGRFEEVYDYDLNSAYPYALSILPPWQAWRRPDGLPDRKGRIGIYLVEWHFPEGWYWYPFPARNRHGGVAFPRVGRGYVMSPELYAVLETVPEAASCVRILWGAVAEGTEGFGAGELPPGGEARLSRLAQSVRKLAATRLRLKQEGREAHRALKLVLNSVYGKLVQQVGRPKFLRFHLGAWVTSVTRAKLWRAIAPVRDKPVVIAAMTDGLASVEPLKLPEGPALGEWTAARVEQWRQWLPGVYAYRNGRDVVHYRGFVRFDPDQAEAAWYGRRYTVEAPVFVTWRLARHQPKAFGDKLRQFAVFAKDLTCDLHSKRQGTDADWRAPLREGQAHRWFAPKESTLRGVDPAADLETWGWPAPIGAEPSYRVATGRSLEADVLAEQQEDDMLGEGVETHGTPSKRDARAAGDDSTAAGRRQGVEGDSEGGGAVGYDGSSRPEAISA